MTERELGPDENYSLDAAPVVGEVIKMCAVAAGISTRKSFGAIGPEEFMQPGQLCRYAWKKFEVRAPSA